ncbi:MAG: class I SAM-dependent methyltransferase [Syntrophomonadaceae bacterium]|nr:class I SAM-dependent methyltransferase [Syntrophomonadaceae bacterium]
MSSKAEEFDLLVREVFAPCYPVVANEIIEKTGISNGLCLDLGCGNGYLGLAIADATNMEVCLLDNDAEMLSICQRNITARQSNERVRTQLGDVHQIPLPEQSVQLVVSRGSVFFWEDPIQAFREIYRVLSPKGIACIGGGFGTVEIKQQIDRQMEQRDSGWKEHLRERIGPGCTEKYPPILSEAGIDNFKIDHGPTGLWIIFGRS